MTDDKRSSNPRFEVGDEVRHVKRHLNEMRGIGVIRHVGETTASVAWADGAGCTVTELTSLRRIEQRSSDANGDLVLADADAGDTLYVGTPTDCAACSRPDLGITVNHAGGRCPNEACTDPTGHHWMADVENGTAKTCTSCGRRTQEAKCVQTSEWGCEARRKLGIARGGLASVKVELMGLADELEGELRDTVHFAIEQIEMATNESAMPQVQCSDNVPIGPETKWSIWKVDRGTGYSGWADGRDGSKVRWEGTRENAERKLREWEANLGDIYTFELRPMPEQRVDYPKCVRCGGSPPDASLVTVGDASDPRGYHFVCEMLDFCDERLTANPTSDSKPT